MSKTLREMIEKATRFDLATAIPEIVYQPNGNYLSRSEVLRIVAEHDSEQNAPRAAWLCVPCNIEVHLGETFGDCPKCSKPMVCND